MVSIPPNEDGLLPLEMGNAVARSPVCYPSRHGRVKLMRYYPLYLDLRGRRCAVVGGGRVAERKVRTLLRAGANVHVISPAVTPRLALLAARKKIDITPRAYRPGDLQGPALPDDAARGKRPVLVFAATGDPEVQTAVRKHAEELGALVNAADDARESDFVVPSSFAQGDLLVALSTSGASPALARRLRRQLQLTLGHEYRAYLRFLRAARKQVMDTVPDEAQRAKIFRRLSRTSVIDWTKGMARNYKQLQAKMDPASVRDNKLRVREELNHVVMKELRGAHPLTQNVVRTMNFGSIDAICLSGFKGFKTVSELQASSCREVPDVPGVYLVLRPSLAVPAFLDASTGGKFKKKDPMVAVSLLENKWVEDALVLYIGKAGEQGKKPTLRSRLRKYMRFGEKKPVDHWGGRYIWQLLDSRDLLVCWKPTPNIVPREVEKVLIQEFKAKYKMLPFANVIN